MVKTDIENLGKNCKKKIQIGQKAYVNISG